MQNVKECVNNTGNLCNDIDINITFCMVHDAIHKLKSNNACGNDGLSAEHFIRADRRITVLLSFFTLVLSHMDIYPITL